MSSSVFVAPLTLELRPSRLLALYLIALHAALPGIFLWAAVPDTWLLLTICASLISLAWHAHQCLNPSRPERLCRVQWQADGCWRLETYDGDANEAHLIGATLWGSWLMLLHFEQANGHRRRLPILADSTGAIQRRRLRVRLLAAGRRAMIRD